MGLRDLFRRPSAPESALPAQPGPRADATLFMSLDDPRLIDFLRIGTESASGVSVTVETAMRNPSVFRSVSLISQSIGMLPCHVLDKTTKEKARDYPLFSVLHRRPNNWQTAYEFRSLMQLRALVKGNAYARILRARDVRRQSYKVIALIPLDPDRVRPVQNPDFSVSYKYRADASGHEETLAPEDVFHLRGLSLDGICGLSLVRQAADAIGLAMAADLALSRVFKNGSFVDGVLKTTQTMTDPAINRLAAMWAARYSGANNAGGTPVLEQGLEYQAIGANPKDAQSNETRGRQIEEIARIFGIPRPLLMVDETSWGSGIEALGQFFVQYGLSPWFEAWQQAAERSLMSEADVEKYEVKFNAGALLRGSMAVQGEFFAKALGAGGHAPFMTPNEVRETLDMPAHADGDALANPMTVPAPANENEAAQRAAAALQEAVEDGRAIKAQLASLGTAVEALANRPAAAPIIVEPPHVTVNLPKRADERTVVTKIDERGRILEFVKTEE